MVVVAVIAIAILIYTYVGYPLAISALAKTWPTRPAPGATMDTPLVSVLIPVHNGEHLVDAKVSTLLAQSYPADRLEILFLSDGSTDGTDERLADHAARQSHVQYVRSHTRMGKPAALNLLRERARGSIFVLTDVRQQMSPNAISRLVAGLSDPGIVCVSGDLHLEGSLGAGAYWKYEQLIRRSESKFRGLVGVTGSLYAIRAEDFPPLPESLLLDDMWVPMRARMDGSHRRIVVDPEAKVFDSAFSDGREFERKTRTLAGNYQLFGLLPGLLDPRRNPSWFETISHKVGRLLCPWALLALLPTTSAAAFSGSAIMQLVCASQLAFYLAAAAGPRAGAFGRIARTFVIMNFAALVGLSRFLRGSQRVTW